MYIGKMIYLLDKYINWLHKVMFLKWLHSHHREIYSQCGNCRNSLSRLFCKIFVKVTVSLNKLLKSWFDDIYFWGESIIHFSSVYCVTLTLTKNFVKAMFLSLIITKLCTKELISRKNFGEREFLVFPQPVKFPWNRKWIFH